MGQEHCLENRKSKALKNFFNAKRKSIQNPVPQWAHFIIHQIYLMNARK